MTISSRFAVQAALVLALPVAAAAAVIGLAVSGGAAPTALLDPGSAVRWGLPVVTVLRELTAAVTLGALLLVACVLPRPRSDKAASAGAPTRARRAVAVDGRAWQAAPVVAAVAGSAWTVLAIIELVLSYASATGRPIAGNEEFGAELSFFVSQIGQGRALLGMVIVAALTAVLALAVTSAVAAGAVALLATVALAVQATTGHAAGAASHELAISSMWLHLAGAATWIGMLVALAILLPRLGVDLPSAVARYSPIAGWAFVAVAVSGVVSAAIRVGGLDDLWGTRYGWLLLAKAGLFGALGLFGWAHRRAVIPQLTARTAARDGASDGAGSTARRSAKALFWRLVAVEVLIMGTVSGVAGALGASRPPVPDIPPPDPTPAWRITGHQLPPELTWERWFDQWRWDVLLAGACAAAIVVYLRWVLTLRRRGDAWPVGRTVSWVAGMLLMTWVTSGGPAMYGHVLFSAHMVEHMLLVMVVPIFLVLAAPVTLAMRALPSRLDDSRGPREWLLGLVNSRWAHFFAHPIIAAVNFAGSMIVFYYSDLFEFALRTYIGHLGMVAHFTLVGYLFVNALIGIDPGPQRPPYPQRLLLMFATMAFHAFFGIALQTDETLLVPEWFGLLGREWGPTAIEDQQAGGAITWGIGEIPMLAMAIALAVAWTRDDERAARRHDRAADRDGDAELRAYNEMLAGLSARDEETEAAARERPGR